MMAWSMFKALIAFNRYSVFRIFTASDNVSIGSEKEMDTDLARRKGV